MLRALAKYVSSLHSRVVFSLNHIYFDGKNENISDCNSDFSIDYGVHGR